MKMPGPVALLIAPLSLLERSKGRKRRAILMLYLGIGLVLGVLAWREASLLPLPKSPQPFDLATQGRIDVPDADNAMAAYREVVATFGELDTKGYSVPRAKAWEVSDWNAADPEVRRWVEDHRDALKAWIPANDRADSLLVQPREMTMSTLLGPVQSIRPYVRLALLEGSRLEQEGDLAGAWRLYRAALRASRYAGRHGGAIQHLIGSVVLRQARPRVEAWIERPGLTPDLLRRAIEDIDACAALSSPASEMVRVEYFSALHTLDHPEIWSAMSDSGPYSTADWTNQISALRGLRRFLRREPERSARVLRLITAGYLAQCDRPRLRRPKLLYADSMIYAHDQRTPRSVRAISSEDLESWYKNSVLNDLAPFGNPIQSHLDADAAAFDQFKLRIAERLFEIERGKQAKTYGELLGLYLEALPEGIDPEDPATQAPE